MYVTFFCIFCNTLFLWLESMASWSQGGSKQKNYLWREPMTALSWELFKDDFFKERHSLIWGKKEVLAHKQLSLPVGDQTRPNMSSFSCNSFRFIISYNKCPPEPGSAASWEHVQWRFLGKNYILFLAPDAYIKQKVLNLQLVLKGVLSRDERCSLSLRVCYT
jgi:hypothetical protein